MKKSLLKFCILLSMTALSACGGGNPSSEDKSSGEAEESSVTEVSSSEEISSIQEPEENPLYAKIWETKTVCEEACVMIEDAETGVKSARLIYTPTKILSVKDCFEQEEYDPSEYYVDGDRICMSNTSTMPFLTQDNITCKEIPELIGGSYDDGKGGKILFTEGPGIIMHQVRVTYEHEDSWFGTIPEKQGAKLPKLQAKLANGEDINFVCNGDSIFTGANASEVLGIEPYQETFPEAFAHEITRLYGNKVIYHNTSVGGKLSDWGKANVESNVDLYNPDLVLIGFGMNDGSWKIPAFDYVENIRFMIRSIQALCENAEIIVAATILANPNSSQNQGQEGYLEPLKEMCDEYEGVALLDMTTFSKDLLTKKTSFDLYANNINHPNDFMVRNYIANLLNLIEVKE